MTNDMNEQLAAAFRNAEDQIHSFDPKVRPTIGFFIFRDYEGNIQLQYNITAYSPGSDDTVRGKILADVVKEYIRRKGFDQEQSLKLISG